MGLPSIQHQLTVEEYLEREELACDKHEFHNGTIILMPGGTYEHRLITSNTNREIGNALKGKPCRVLDSGLKVALAHSTRYVYPDVLVVCGEPKFDSRTKDRRVIVNPRLVVEVISPTSEAYDRGDKFDWYRQLDSFEEYLLVSQKEASVQTFFRQSDGSWLFTPYTGIQTAVKLRSLDASLSMAEIYSGVGFQPQPTPEPSDERM